MIMLKNEKAPVTQWAFLVTQVTQWPLKFQYLDKNGVASKKPNTTSSYNSFESAKYENKYRAPVSKSAHF